MSWAQRVYFPCLCIGVVDITRNCGPLTRLLLSSASLTVLRGQTRTDCTHTCTQIQMCIGTKCSGDLRSSLNEVRGEEQQVTFQSWRWQWQLLQLRRSSISGREVKRRGFAALQCVKTGLETKLSWSDWVLKAELKHSFGSSSFTIGCN